MELTEGREDLLASVPGLSPFAVECKRPVAARTFASNVRKLRRQLYQRCRDCYEHGIAVLGVDRAMGLTGTLREATSLADLDARLTLGLELTCREMIRLGGPKLAAVAPAVVAVVTGCVFVEPVRGPVTFETLMLDLTGAQGSATRLKYEAALSPFF